MRRMHFVKTAAFALALVLVTHSVSEAQRPGRGGFGRGGGFGGGGSLTLLRSEYVQQELNLTADQKTKLRELAEEARKSAGDRGGRDLSQEERRKRFAEAREQRQKLEQQAEQILTGEQQKRLQGIQLQLAGPEAVARDEIAKEIGLTDSQKEKIRGIVRQDREESRKLFEGLRDLSQEDRREKFRELAEKRQAARKETESKINEVLTKQQQEKLEQLKGKPVDRSKLFQGRRRRGRDS